MSSSASETATALWGVRVVAFTLLLDLASDGDLGIPSKSQHDVVCHTSAGDLGVPVQFPAQFCVSHLTKDSR